MHVAAQVVEAHGPYGRLVGVGVMRPVRPVTSRVGVTAAGPRLRDIPERPARVRPVCAPETDTGRTETVIPLEQPVLDPCWYHGTQWVADLRKLSPDPRSPRSTRAPTRSSASSWPASSWS